MPQDLPLIDERIEFQGTTFLRQLNGDALRSLDKVVVIHDGEDRLAVLVPYDQYMSIQEVAAKGESVDRCSK